VNWKTTVDLIALSSGIIKIRNEEEAGGGKMRGKEDGLDVLHGQRPKRAMGKVCAGDSAGKIGGGRFICVILQRGPQRAGSWPRKNRVQESMAES